MSDFSIDTNFSDSDILREIQSSRQPCAELLCPPILTMGCVNTFSEFFQLLHTKQPAHDRVFDSNNQYADGRSIPNTPLGIPLEQLILLRNVLVALERGQMVGDVSLILDAAQIGVSAMQGTPDTPPILIPFKEDISPLLTMTVRKLWGREPINCRKQYLPVPTHIAVKAFSALYLIDDQLRPATTAVCYRLLAKALMPWAESAPMLAMLSAILAADAAANATQAQLTPSITVDESFTQSLRLELIGYIESFCCILPGTAVSELQQLPGLSELSESLDLEEPSSMDASDLALLAKLSLRLRELRTLELLNGREEGDVLAPCNLDVSSFANIDVEDRPETDMALLNEFAPELATSLVDGTYTVPCETIVRARLGIVLTCIAQVLSKLRRPTRAAGPVRRLIALASDTQDAYFAVSGLLLAADITEGQEQVTVLRRAHYLAQHRQAASSLFAAVTGELAHAISMQGNVKEAQELFEDNFRLTLTSRMPPSVAITHKLGQGSRQHEAVAQARILAGYSKGRAAVSGRITELLEELNSIQ